jgi:hypothetical protein
LSTREIIANTGWTVLPHPAHSPDLAPSDCHLFGPVKNAVRGQHFTDDRLKVLMMCSEVEVGNFTTLVHVSLNAGKSVLKMVQTVWKKSLTTAKEERIIHVNFVVIAITFSEKKLEALPSYAHRISVSNFPSHITYFSDKFIKIN